jgi:hypothetical protein
MNLDKCSYFFLLSLKVCLYLGRLLISLCLPSSFHGSYEYGMSAPLQSKNDIHKIEPFSRKMGPPFKFKEGEEIKENC